MTFALIALTLSACQAPAAAAQEPRPQIEWQRTLADAQAVQQATGRPLLICVNMDGEPFCEIFAPETYRDPAFVAATRGYVCLIASPDHHNPTDYDGQGRRIECPRFGGCTCSEHINVEPGVFALYFNGQRAAPRHVGVDKDGKILFDRFLDRSMQLAIDAVKQHAGAAPDTPLPTDPAALFARRDAAARQALEAIYQKGDRAARLALLEQAGKARNEPFDLLRMGLRDDDVGVFTAAASALAATATSFALIDVEDALARADDPKLADALGGRIAQLARQDDASKQFHQHRGAVLAAQQAIASTPLLAALQKGGAGNAPAAEERDAIEARLDTAEQQVRQKPDDAVALVALATGNLDLAMHLLPAGDKTVPLLLEDACRFGERARPTAEDEALQLRLQTTLAVAFWQRGDGAAARPHAKAALDLALALGERCDPRPQRFAQLFGAAARSAAADAYAKAQQDAAAIVADDLGEAAQAFLLLAEHPRASEADLREGAALLAFGGARRQAQALLARALQRFPASRELHQDFRDRIVADRGAEALRRRYAEWQQQAADQPTAEWFAGYAAIVAAELHMQNRRRPLAAVAYTECIERFGRAARQNADYADSSNHLAVLALAGRALIEHEAGESERAVDDLLAALALRPASMADTDGLGRKPEAVLRRIADELRAQGKAELADRLPKAQ